MLHLCKNSFCKKIKLVSKQEKCREKKCRIVQTCEQIKNKISLFLCYSVTHCFAHNLVRQSVRHSGQPQDLQGPGSNLFKGLKFCCIINDAGSLRFTIYTILFVNIWGLRLFQYRKSPPVLLYLSLYCNPSSYGLGLSNWPAQ